MKYYFISYQWSLNNSKWFPANVVVDKHPMEWLKETIDECSETYRIVFFHEISKEHFMLLDGQL